MASDQEAGEPQKRRKRRWGVAAPATPAEDSSTPSVRGAATGGARSVLVIPGGGVVAPPLAVVDDPKAKAIAMQESIRARLAAAKAKLQQPQPLVGLTPALHSGSATTSTPSASSNNSAGLKRTLDLGASAATTPTTGRSDNQFKRAKRFDVDFTVVTGPPKSISTSAVTTTDVARKAPSKKVNPYLAHTIRSPAQQQPNESSGAAAAALLEGAPPKDTHEDEDVAGGDNEDDVVDARLIRTSKPRSRHRQLTFVEPGHWQQVADKKREQAAKAEAAGFVSGRKLGHTITSVTMADVYGPTISIAESGGTALHHDDDPVAHPRADAVPEPDAMPLVMEWWDMALLPLNLRKEVATVEAQILTKHTKAAMQQQLLLQSDEAGIDPLNGESESPTTATTTDALHESKEIQDLRSLCYHEASMVHSKTAALVQHIVPIQQPRLAPERQPTVHLTKKELKRQRKLRRQARQRELQDMQAAGLVPAPEPRLTLRNFIQVLGDQAYLDPSQMEQKVQEQMEARQRAHLERNQANKLTKEQKAAKLARKFAEDTSGGVTVAIFYVLDLSHPYHRTKVDLNAQQNNITGGVLECQVPRLSCVVCEGGPKAVKRYRRLMEVRMKWTGPDDTDGSAAVAAVTAETGENPDGPVPVQFNPNNRCELVWQGMAVKRHFKGFVFQSCETAEQARKILKSKGVAHYWDQVLDFHQSGRSSNTFKLRLTDDHSDSDSEEEEEKEDEVVIMETDE